ncbi:MAG: superoxide dismutase [Nitrospirota bacterium]|nr:superoxide dismutase [Nitrospirota bacterium]
MPYAAKDYAQLVGMKGFSETLLKNHVTLYQGYVANTNKVGDILLQMLKDGKTAVPEYAELKRRFGWEFNGMRLHELYFDNLKGAGPLSRSGKLAGKLEKEFGSLEAWEKDFKACGTIRGIGWVVLYFDHAGDRLFNSWINEHDVAHLTGCSPLLIMDVFEHAYLTDYQLKRADYIEAFFSNINWNVVESRLS